MRQVHIDEDLSGRTLDAALTGHAHESLFLRCNLSGTVFLGSWAGSDFFRCVGAVDFRQGDMYATYWRGNILAGSQWPTDIGFMQHFEPIAALIKDRAAALVTNTTQRTIVNRVADIAGSYRSWNDSPTDWWTSSTSNRRTLLATAFRKIFGPYPQLLSRFEHLLAVLKSGRTPELQILSPVLDITWPDGAAVRLDATNLPALPDPSRYPLSGWVEAQAGPGHECFITSIHPPAVIYGPAEAAFRDRRGGL